TTCLERAYGLASAIDSSPLGLTDGRGSERHARPCFRHEFLPLRVDPSLPQHPSTPSLHPPYPVSTLLWVDPTLGHALVLSPSGVFPLWLSLALVTPGSHVPRESPDRDHAAFMPVRTASVSRSRLGWVPGPRLEPGFGDAPALSTPPRRFPCVRLLGPHLTGSRPAFSGTLTTGAFGPSGFRWFGIWSCHPIPRDLPSSLTRPGVPDRALCPVPHAFVAHHRPHSGRGRHVDAGGAPRPARTGGPARSAGTRSTTGGRPTRPAAF